MSPLLTGFPFGGAAGIPLATVTATTGSPSVDTTTRAGKTIYKFTGSGTITIGTAGTCEVLVVGGGGSCGRQGPPAPGTVHPNGGGGGLITNSTAFLSIGTKSIIVGAGGFEASGNKSEIVSAYSAAGGGGYGNTGGTSAPGGIGAGGSGAGGSVSTGGPAIGGGIGFSGGAGFLAGAGSSSNAPGGGGGAGSA